MKRTAKIALLFVAIVLIFCFVFVGCDENDSEQKRACFRVDGKVYHYKPLGENGEICFPEEPTKADYRFDGWVYEDGNGNTVMLTPEYRFQEEKLIYDVHAVFSLIGKNYISYELFEGENHNENPTICYDTDIGENAYELKPAHKKILVNTEYEAVGDRIRKSEYYREYLFEGWYSDEAFLKEVVKLDYSLGSVTLYAKWSESFDESTVVSESDMFIDGNSVYMGSYPSALVEDADVLSALNMTTEALPTADNFNGWTSLGFYIDAKQEDYAWYIDVEFGGIRYRAIYFTEYRPDNAEYDLPELSQQEKNGYLKNNVYWFKFEPIKWDILQKADGKALLYSHSILDSVSWQENVRVDGKIKYVDDGIAPEGTYANNYEYSSIRRLLNGSFFSFALAENERVLTYQTDNSVITSFVNPNPYLCENTEDKVFLLSYKDLINPEYGFDKSYSVLDEQRRKEGTDYANALGLRYSNGEYAKYSSYWLRTPFYDSANVPHLVKETGYSTAICAATESCVGLVPAIYISIE